MSVHRSLRHNQQWVCCQILALIVRSLSQAQSKRNRYECSVPIIVLHQARHGYTIVGYIAGVRPVCEPSLRAVRGGIAEDAHHAVSRTLQRRSNLYACYVMRPVNITTFWYCSWPWIPNLRKFVPRIRRFRWLDQLPAKKQQQNTRWLNPAGNDTRIRKMFLTLPTKISKWR